jgi:hypothetical protein
MSVFDDIRAEINKRAASLVLPHFLALEKAKHANNGFKNDCPCDYCRAKRTATSEIGHIGRGLFMDSVPINDDHTLYSKRSEQRSYTRAVFRESLRLKHRQRLKELYDV